MKFLKYSCMALLLASAFAFTSVAVYAQEEVEEACAEEASVSAVPFAAAAFLGIPSAFVFARRRRRTKR